VTLAVALSLLVCIRLHEAIAICVDRGGNRSSLADVAVIWQVAPVSSLHIPPTTVVGRLPFVVGDAFPQTSDVVLVSVIYGDSEVESLDLYAGNGSSSPDVALIWQVAPVSSLQIPPSAVVGRLRLWRGMHFCRQMTSYLLPLYTAILESRVWTSMPET